MDTTETAAPGPVKRRRPSLPLDLGALALPFLMDAGVALGFVGFPLAAIRLGASPLHLGLLGCASPGCFVLSCLLVGSISDRWGRRPAMVAGALAYALSFFLACQAQSLPMLMLAAMAVGASGGFFWPALEAAIADAFGHGPLGRGLVLFNVGWTAGMMLGAASGGLLADLGAAFPFVMATVVTAATLPILFLWPPPGTAHAAEDAVPDAVPAAPPAAGLFLNLARIGNFCGFFAMVSMRALFPKLGTDLHLTGGSIGALIGGVSLAQAVAFMPLARWRRWEYRLAPLIIAEAALMLALLGIWRASSPLLFAPLFAVVGGACALTYTASLFYSLNRPEDRGKMGAMHEAILGSGGVLGPLLGGILAEHAGVRAPYSLAAALVAVGMLLQALLYQQAGKPGGGRCVGCTARVSPRETKGNLLPEVHDGGVDAGSPHH